jgi:hypothetical protein
VGTNQTPIAPGAYNSTYTTLPQLVLTNVATGYSGLFRVAVTSGTNTVVSEPAQLSVVLGVASQLRLGTVSVSTNSGTEVARQFSFPVVFSVFGSDRGVGATWTFDPSVVREVSFVPAADAPTNTTVRSTLQPGRFSFVYSLTNDPSIGFFQNQQIGQLVLTTAADRDPAQALAAARLVPVEADPATVIARPFLPLSSGSDRVLGTNLADRVTFPLNLLMTPQVIPSGSVTLNRQTGYFEQAAQIVNLRSDALADVLLIRDDDPLALLLDDDRRHGVRLGIGGLHRDRELLVGKVAADGDVDRQAQREGLGRGERSTTTPSIEW